MLDSLDSRLQRNSWYRAFSIPLKKATTSKLPFLKWLCLSFGLPLAVFWIPLFLSVILHDLNFLEKVLLSSTFPLFSFVFLSERIVGLLSDLNINKNDNAASVRVIVSVCAIIIVSLQLALWTLHLFADSPSEPVGELILFILTFFMGVIFFSIQGNAWEPSLEKVAATQDKKVEALGDSANNKKEDGEGNKI